MPIGGFTTEEESSGSASTKQPTGLISAFKGFLRSFGGEFITSTILGWIIELLFAISSQPTWYARLEAFCILWFASGAAFFIGTLAGFIFGFPKSRSDASSVLARYGDNTNLEEVSDWLTKIIVGIGIAQFWNIVLFINSIGQAVSQSLPSNGSEASKIIALASMIYGFVCGFLYYYVWARLRLFDELQKRTKVIEANKIDADAKVGVANAHRHTSRPYVSKFRK